MANRAADERLAHRTDPVDVSDGQIPGAAVDAVIADADTPLGALEIRQYIDITPAAIATLQPGVEIRALAMVVDHAVDRARTAQRSRLRRCDRPASRACGPFCLEQPSVLRVVLYFYETGQHVNEWHVNEWMPARRPTLQYTVRRARFFGQTLGQHRSRGTAAHNP